MIKRGKIIVQDIIDYCDFIKNCDNDTRNWVFLVSRYFDLSQDELLKMDYKEFEKISLEVQDYLENKDIKRQTEEIIKHIGCKNLLNFEQLNRFKFIDFEK